LTDRIGADTRDRNGGGGGSYLSNLVTDQFFAATLEFRGGRITITQLSGATVPEPSTWAKTLAGLGWVARMRRRKGKLTPA
jgi:hypothetical protein